MRVTQFSQYASYLRTLNDTSSTKAKVQTAIYTGEALSGIGDDPVALSKSKRLQAIVSRNKQYDSNMTAATSDLQATTTQLESMSDLVSKLSETVTSVSTDSSSAVATTLASTVKGAIDDMLNAANTAFNGKFLFAGTKTTSASLDTSKTNTNNMPFELVKGTATTANPSGLSVVFKGNYEARSMTISASRSETLNTTADDIFGTGGVEMLNKAIELYNKLEYKSDGTARKTADSLTTADCSAIESYSSDFASYYDKINAASARTGGIIDRIATAQTQLTSENTVIKDFLSQNKDTDEAQATIDLNKATNTLNYALAVGSKIFSQTLFDFLT